MADFVQKTTVKSSTRKLTSPIPDLTTFVILKQTIIDTNPWGCVDYVSNGATIDGCLAGSEKYTGRIVYENGQAKTVGQIGISAQSAAAFNTDVNTILGIAALGTAMGGIPSHDSSEDSFSSQIKCNHSNGEKYTVTLKRDSITISSYETDAIVTAIETWADGLPILA